MIKHAKLQSKMDCLEHFWLGKEELQKKKQLLLRMNTTSLLWKNSASDYPYPQSGG